MLEPVPPSRLRTAALAVAVSAAVLVGVGGVAYALGHRDGEIRPADWRPLVPVADGSPSPTRLPLSDVARAALSRVVTVEAVREGSQALGTAWLLDGRGDFVTNAHVLQDGRAIRIRDRAGATHVGIVVAADRETDLAVVRSADGFGGTPLPLERADPAVPEDVVVLSAGRATGHEDVIPDRVGRLHVDVPVRGNADIDPAMGTGTVVYHDMIGLDAARIYSGNSGGPVLDGSGRVIGMITLASRSTAQAFALPMGRVADELIAMARNPAPA